MQDEENQTPLHQACKGGHIDVIQYLIKEAYCDVGEYYIVMTFQTAGTVMNMARKIYLQQWCCRCVY